MAPSKIETFLFGITLLLAVPYMLFSIRLHAHSVNPDSSTVTVPTDHVWRLSSLRAHKNRADIPYHNGEENEETSYGNYPLTSVLKPGREAVEQWLRQHRDNFPSFVTANIPGIFHRDDTLGQTSFQHEQAVSNEELARFATDALSSVTDLASPTEVNSHVNYAPSSIESPQPHVNSKEGSLLQQSYQTEEDIQVKPSSVESNSASINTQPEKTVKRKAIIKKPPAHERGFVFDSPLDADWVKKKEQVSSVLTKPSARCLLFTMDSIDNYIEKSKRGGASGEITIRESLVGHLESVLNVKTDVARSDKEFDTLARGIKEGVYSFIVLDAWTWAAKGWVPKPPLIGHEHKVFLLDFFGAKAPARNGIKVPKERILTAFPIYPGNTFLGYAVPQSQLPNKDLYGSVTKKPQGVIWGKDPKHYKGREAMLKAVAAVATLHSTLSKSDAPTSLRSHPNIIWHGHLSKPQWQQLLAESMFMLGIGNPLVGPSAVDAVVAGCVYINPTYSSPVKEVYMSQHPYLEKFLGVPHVCSAPLGDASAMAACATQAIQKPVEPLIPKELTEQAYSTRIQQIFGPYVASNS